MIAKAHRGFWGHKRYPRGSGPEFAPKYVSRYHRNVLQERPLPSGRPVRANGEILSFDIRISSRPLANLNALLPFCHKPGRPRFVAA
jgi:hypothetical protein